MSEHWDRIKEIFQQALERPAGDRRAFLDQACAGDPEMRADVQSLLEAHRASGDFLERPPSREAAAVVAERDSTAESDPAPPAADLVGRHLGPYEVRRRIARGGIGEIYRAVRTDDFRKEVAVKVIRSGMATEDVLRRFRDERQILAAIEHPNIARLLDGGSTDDGFPYLVMELIEGVPIDLFCDDRKLGVRDRLELFLTLCEAVQVAHRNLVVHRDLKPGNVLVDDTGTPKLLDFGIAKILVEEPGEATSAATRIGRRMLTPAYASPEQLLGEPVTTATDVYSLGVLLFELLTGRRPYEAETAEGDDPTARVLAGIPATRPSAVAAADPEAATRRSTTPERLRRRLAGDLDNIVSKALRRDPERRYHSVERLAEDVRRHLAGQPVSARPDTLGYRAGKFLRRHKLPAALAALVLLSLVGFLAILAGQNARLARARNLAESEATRARLVSGFLQEVLADPDPFEGRLSRDATVIESLVAAVPRIDDAFRGEPLLEAAIRQTIGLTFLRLGRYQEARPLLERALQIRLENPATPTGERLESLEATGRLRQELGEYAAAEELYRRALEISREAGPEDSAATATALNRLATVRHDLGDDDDAEALYREALEMRRRLFGEEHADVATSLDDLANLFHDHGDLEAAEGMYREALEIRRRLLGPDHPDLAVSLNNVGVVLHDQERLEEAEKLYRESLELTRRAFGDRHPGVATGFNNLASLLADRGRSDEAEALYRRALTILREAFGEEHPAIVDQLGNLGAFLQDEERWDEAEELFRQAAGMSRRAFGEEHVATGLALQDLAELLLERQRLDRAETAARQALAVFRRAQAGDRYETALGLDTLAAVLAEAERDREAVESLTEAIEMLERLDEDPELVAELRISQGESLIRLDRPEEARAALRRAHDVLTASAGPEDDRTRQAAELLGRLGAARE